MTAPRERANRWFVKRCNGAQPGELIDEAQAAATLKRVADSGSEIIGSLLIGSVSWQNSSLDLTFSLTEVTEADAKARERAWGAAMKPQIPLNPVVRLRAAIASGKNPRCQAMVAYVIGAPQTDHEQRDFKPVGQQRTSTEVGSGLAEICHHT